MKKAALAAAKPKREAPKEPTARDKALEVRAATVFSPRRARSARAHHDRCGLPRAAVRQERAQARGRAAQAARAARAQARRRRRCSGARPRRSRRRQGGRRGQPAGLGVRRRRPRASGHAAEHAAAARGAARRRPAQGRGHPLAARPHPLTVVCCFPLQTGPLRAQQGQLRRMTLRGGAPAPPCAPAAAAAAPRAATPAATPQATGSAAGTRTHSNARVTGIGWAARAARGASPLALQSLALSAMTRRQSSARPSRSTRAMSSGSRSNAPPAQR